VVRNARQSRRPGEYPSHRCHHSCAQHYISESACSPAKLRQGEEQIEGYHIYVGGGLAPTRALGREIYRDVRAEDTPRTIAQMLKGYLAHRASCEETFLTFSRRHEVDALKDMFAGEAGE